MKSLGFITYADLHGQELTSDDIRAAIADGKLKRVRRGVFCTPNESPTLITAISSGGRIGCLSGCELHGVWTPPNNKLHIAYFRLPANKLTLSAKLHAHARNTSIDQPLSDERTAHDLGQQILWEWYPSRPAGYLLPLSDCLQQVFHRHGREYGLITLESAVNRRLIGLNEALQILDRAPRRGQLLDKFFDPRAESGSETRVRLFFQQNRIPVKTQEYHRNIGRVDMQVGRSLVVEVDSQTYHGYQREIEADHRRDAALRLRGYSVLRLSYGQIWYEWAKTQEFLRKVIRTRNHMRPPRPLV